MNIQIVSLDLEINKGKKVQQYHMLWPKIQKQLDDQQLTVLALSQLTKIPNNTLYNYKNHGIEPSFKNMVKIADALNVSLDVFR